MMVDGDGDPSRLCAIRGDEIQPVKSGWEELLPNNNFRLCPVEPERGRISQERG